ncbi:MAG: type II secretion system protein F [Candidatus Nanopelagicales bacterium]|nr:type II secretion system protein F [Candidatus Nanopelagicales bacterium]
MGAVLGLLIGAGIVLIFLSLTDGSDSRATRSRQVGALTRLVERSGIPRLTAANLLGACFAASILVGSATLIVTAVPMVALLAAAVAGYLPFLVIKRRVSARAKALRVSWPDAVDALVSAVRAGMSLPEALADLARRGPEPLRPSFSAFAAEHRAAGSFAAALDILQDHLADPVADRVIASLRIAREVGGTDLGTVLRTLSTLLREDARTRGDIEARQSWTVSAARMAVAAPWITLALLCTRPEAVAAYNSWSGALVIALAGVLSIAAYRVMLAIGRLPIEPRMIT